MAYEVQTPVYEGPFDVLLHLITKQQVELYEISISKIVDGFLAHLQEMEKSAKANGVPLDLETITQFLLIAATLVDLKARRLLPGRQDADLDEELALWEERDLLLARLVECKTFKDAALALVALEDAAKRSYPRRAGLEERYLKISPDPLSGTKADDLRRAFLRVVKPKPEAPKVSFDHVTQIKISVGDAIADLSESLPTMGRTTFRKLTAEHTEPMEIIVYFLAILEMYKQGLVDIEQAISFGELEVTSMASRSDDFVIDLRDRQTIDAYEG